MVRVDFRGVIPYLVTPIGQDGHIKRDVLTRLCADLVDQGVHGLTPLGSTGEYAYLSEAQRRNVVETVVAAASGRVPVLPGVASTSIRGAIEQAKSYERLGVDGIVAVLDAYFPLTEADVERYFASIADAVDLPIILYTNPNFQRSDLSITTIEKLAKYQNIVGLKDASSNTGRLLSIINRCGEELSIYAASSHVTACVMMMGGKGWFAGPACVLPRQSVQLYKLCLAGRWEDAFILQKKLWYFNELFARFNLAACIKAALEQQGYDVGVPIAPQTPISEDGRMMIADLMARLHIAE